MIEITETVIVGTKQVLKLLEKDAAKMVYLANDADAHILQKLTKALRGKSASIVRVESMRELGMACGIDVGAAVAAVEKS